MSSPALPARPADARLPHRARAAAATLAACLALAACGGGGGDGGSTPPPPPPPPPAALLDTLNAAGAGGSIEARTSMQPTNGAEGSTVFDDFSLTTAASITTLRWQGIYCVQANGAAAPAATASEFVVRIHADVAGRPNLASALLQARYTPAQAGQTFERNVGGLSCGSATGTNWALYDYSATLPTPFAAAANTRYWISVEAVTPSYDVYWGWRAGTTANGQSLLRFTGNYDVLTLDRALRLAP